MLTLAHPTPEQLRDFGNGCLDASEIDGIEEHLAACDSCCRSLGESPSDDFVEQLQAIVQSPHFRKVAGGEVEQIIPPVETPEAPAELIAHPRYRVLRLLGHGGMGDVFLAEHLVLQRMAALKIIRPAHLHHPEGMVRFRREMQAVARLAHPNIVAAYDAEPVGNSALLAMEYVEGETLAEYVERQGPRPIEEATALVGQIAQALDHAWRRGPVHRDMKPHNVIRTPEGSVKVLDFGLAQFAAQPERDAALEETWEESAPSLTRPGSRLGTPAFMSPEQSRGEKVDIRTDIYGLGAILTFLLLGAEASARLRRSLTGGETAAAKEELAAVDPRLRSIVRRALATDPNDRFATPAEFIRALPSPGSRGGGSRWTRRLLAGGLCGAFALLATVIVSISTDEGLVEIRSDDPNVKIRIVRGGRTVAILDTQTNQKTVLDTGEYQLRLVRDNNEVETMDLPETFTLQRGERRVFTISRKVRSGRSGDSGRQPTGLPSVTKGVDSRRAHGGIRQLHALAWPAAHVYHTAFSNAHDKLLGCGDSGLRVWQVETGKLLHDLDVHDGYTQAAVFTPDDRFIVAGGWQDPTIAILDAKTGEVVRRLRGHEAGLVRLDISGDGERILSGSADATLRIWDFESGKLLHTLVGHKETCGGRFSSNAERVLSFSHDGTARLWSTKTGKQLKVLVGHQGKLAGCAFGPEDGQAVTWGYDRTIRTWDLSIGHELRQITLKSDLAQYFRAVTVDPKCGRTLSCHGDPWLRLARLKDGTELARIEMPLELKGFAFSADCRLASAGSFRGWVYLFELPVDGEKAEASP